uniref:Uncharacterized protein n=1 Tax=Hanusia phi TaxID=3032 RepID=A0A7S0HT15_9CRYP|mmetsp:Transcript_31664/g.71216  ORF Transcript_31664/g.71216 Transcript_31664/m.71216 type:complete len:113 (+) Transcript_31664:87-425(+)|eukprot:765007-Hanusia_phi.AAC.6
MCNLVHGENNQTRSPAMDGKNPAERQRGCTREEVAGYDCKNASPTEDLSACTDDKCNPCSPYFFEKSVYSVHQEKSIDRFGNLSEKTCYSFFQTGGMATSKVIDRYGNFVTK